MASLTKLPSGRWRVQVRRKGQHASRTFRLKSDAEAWAKEVEDKVSRGRSAVGVEADASMTFGFVVDLHMRDLAEVGIPLMRSKAYTLAKLKDDLGTEKLKQVIPPGRLVKFAVATAMRQEEICTLLCTDVDFATQLAIVRNRKDPRRKSGNHQKVPLLDATGYDAIALLREQQAQRLGGDRVFPYNQRSLGAAFRRACEELRIEDLHFHDLRHEANKRSCFTAPQPSHHSGGNAHAMPAAMNVSLLDRRGVSRAQPCKPHSL